MKKEFVVFDLEASCEDKKITPIYDNEIIEIGAVKVNSEGKVLDTLDVYIKPTRTEITDFCTNLTGITKDKIAKDGISFEDAFNKFADFVGDRKLLSWGHYDKKQVKKDLMLNRLTKFNYLVDGHRSLKHEYADLYAIKPCGMAKALNRHQIKLEGTHHNGLDDALNIAKILQVMISEKNFQ